MNGNLTCSFIQEHSGNGDNVLWFWARLNKSRMRATAETPSERHKRQWHVASYLFGIPNKIDSGFFQSKGNDTLPKKSFMFLSIDTALPSLPLQHSAALGPFIAFSVVPAPAQASPSGSRLVYPSAGSLAEGVMTSPCRAEWSRTLERRPGWVVPNWVTWSTLLHSSCGFSSVKWDTSASIWVRSPINALMVSCVSCLYDVTGTPVFFLESICLCSLVQGNAPTGVCSIERKIV